MWLLIAFSLIFLTIMILLAVCCCCPGCYCYRDRYILPFDPSHLKLNESYSAFNSKKMNRFADGTIRPVMVVDGRSGQASQLTTPGIILEKMIELYNFNNFVFTSMCRSEGSLEWRKENKSTPADYA